MSGVATLPTKNQKKRTELLQQQEELYTGFELGYAEIAKSENESTQTDAEGVLFSFWHTVRGPSFSEPIQSSFVPNTG